MLSSPPRRLVLIGATGAVGRNVLAEALRSPAFETVTTLGRRSVDIADGAEPPAKLAQHIVDLEDPPSYRALVAGHTAAICTLGVGEPSKSTRAEVWKIEVDYVMGFAALCKEAGVRHFSLMTSVGSDARSISYYLRLKGTQEDRVKALGFERTSLVRPSMLLTPHNRYGARQAVILAVWPKIDWMLAGPLRHYRGIRVEDLGRAIAMNAARDGPGGVELLEWDGFQRILHEDAADPTPLAFENYELRSPEFPDEWARYHEIRRRVLFEARGHSHAYDAGHPDERRPGNHPKLLIYAGDVVGVVRIDLVPPGAIVRRVAVREDVQRKGHGRALLALAEQFARAQGCTELRSSVDPDAVAFYEKCGFTIIRTRPLAGRATLMAKATAKFAATTSIARRGKDP